MVGRASMCGFRCERRQQPCRRSLIEVGLWRRGSGFAFTARQRFESPHRRCCRRKRCASPPISRWRFVHEHRCRRSGLEHGGVEESHQRSHGFEHPEEFRIKARARGKGRLILARSDELLELEVMRCGMLFRVTVGNARQAIAGQLADRLLERRCCNESVKTGMRRRDLVAYRLQSEVDGMYMPPPIHTQPGATSKYRPAPSFRVKWRLGKCAATAVLSGDLSLLNRVSR